MFGSLYNNLEGTLLGDLAPIGVGVNITVETGDIFFYYLPSDIQTMNCSAPRRPQPASLLSQLGSAHLILQDHPRVDTGVLGLAMQLETLNSTTASLQRRS